MSLNLISLALPFDVVSLAQHTRSPLQVQSQTTYKSRQEGLEYTYYTHKSCWKLWFSSSIDNGRFKTFEWWNRWKTELSMMDRSEIVKWDMVIKPLAKLYGEDAIKYAHIVECQIECKEIPWHISWSKRLRPSSSASPSFPRIRRQNDNQWLLFDCGTLDVRHHFKENGCRCWCEQSRILNSWSDSYCSIHHLNSSLIDCTAKLNESKQALYWCYA